MSRYDIDYMALLSVISHHRHRSVSFTKNLWKILLLMLHCESPVKSWVKSSVKSPVNKMSRYDYMALLSG